MKKIGLKYIEGYSRNAKARKAVALLLYVKHRYRSSTLLKFTYKKLQEETGMAFSTLKKRMEILNQLGLVEKIGKNGKHLLFKSVKGRKINLDVSKIDFSSVKTIELGLCAMFIVNVQRKKEYVKQLFHKMHECKRNPHKCKEHDFKSLRKKMRKYGYDENDYFMDNGISYKYMAKNLHIGKTKIAKMIKQAIENNMLKQERHFKLIYYEEGMGHFAVKYAGCSESSRVFASRSCVFKVLKACTYSIV